MHKQIVFRSSRLLSSVEDTNTVFSFLTRSCVKISTGYSSLVRLKTLSFLGDLTRNHQGSNGLEMTCDVLFGVCT